MVLYLFAAVFIAITALCVRLGNQGDAVFYALAVLVGIPAAVLTLMCSAAFLGADNARAWVRGSILFAVAGAAAALFGSWGYHESWPYFLLAVPCGLLAAFALVFGIVESVPPDPVKVARWRAEQDARESAELRARGYLVCKGCGELAPPPADGKTCHGCGGPLRGGEYKCVCGECYAAHLASD